MNKLWIRRNKVVLLLISFFNFFFFLMAIAIALSPDFNEGGLGLLFRNALVNFNLVIESFMINIFLFFIGFLGLIFLFMFMIANFIVYKLLAKRLNRMQNLTGFNKMSVLTILLNGFIFAFFAFYLVLNLKNIFQGINSFLLFFGI